MASRIPSGLFFIEVLVFTLFVVVSAIFYGLFWMKIEPLLRKGRDGPKPFLYLNSAFEHLWAYKKIQNADGGSLTIYHTCMTFLLAQWTLIAIWVALFVIELWVVG